MDRLFGRRMEIPSAFHDGALPENGGEPGGFLSLCAHKRQCWLLYQPLTGGPMFTAGLFGNKPVGLRFNFELEEMYDPVSGEKNDKWIVYAVSQPLTRRQKAQLDLLLSRDPGWGLYYNCVYHAVAVWNALGLPHMNAGRWPLPSAILRGIRRQPGHTRNAAVSPFAGLPPHDAGMARPAKLQRTE